MRIPLAKRLTAVACALSLSALAAGCGSSGDPAGDPGSKDASGAVAEAKKVVDELSGPQTFSVEAVAKKPAKGLVVAEVNCVTPTCKPDEMREPVEALGWKYERNDYDLTKGAQDFLRAVDTALESKPDLMVVYMNYGTTIMERQLDRAKAEGIPVVGIGGGPDVSKVDIMLQSPAAFEAVGANQANLALADAGKSVKVGMPVDRTVSAFAQTADGMKKKLAEDSGSKADIINVSFSQPQPSNVSAIINYLKSNPDTDYLLLPGTAFYTGLQQGLQAAGLKDKIKLILAFPFTAPDLKAIKNGEFAGTVAAENTALTWRAVDAMVRLSTDGALPTKTPLPDARIVNQDNASLASFDPPKYKEAYFGAWGVTS